MGALTIQRAADHSILYIPIQNNQPPPGLPGNPPIIYAVRLEAGIIIDSWGWKAEIPIRPSTDGTDQTDQAAWAAFDPIAMRLYTSPFYQTRDDGVPGTMVDVYAISTSGFTTTGLTEPLPGNSFTIDFTGSMSFFETDGVTPVLLKRIQGGFITSNRHLYLVNDDGTGILGFDLITARLMATIPVDYTPTSVFSSDQSYQELEGACVFSNCPSPGIDGDIHIIMLFNAIFDKFYFKHYSVTDDADREFI
jgi:hypothetical protein